MKKNFLTFAFVFCFIISKAQTINVRQAGNVLTTTKGNNNSIIIGKDAGNAMISNSSNVISGESVFIGQQAGSNNLAEGNVFIGHSAGSSNINGGYNTFIGRETGKNNLHAWNTFIGGLSGTLNNHGYGNTFLGFYSGYSNTTGFNNTFIGMETGGDTSIGANNTFLGRLSGNKNGNGNNNVYLGFCAGQNSLNKSNNTIVGWQAGFNSGSNNVMIGFTAGKNETGDNKLFIDNSETQSPLILGDFSNDHLKFNGTVGIGGNSTTGFGNYPSLAGGISLSNYKLFVKGGILAEELRVALSSTWADYVFSKDYELKSLEEVEKFIIDNGHLPNVPNAKQVKEEGINVAEMTRIQQEKIEELTLYIINLHKKIEELDSKINKLKN